VKRVPEPPPRPPGQRRNRNDLAGIDHQVRIHPGRKQATFQHRYALPAMHHSIDAAVSTSERPWLKHERARHDSEPAAP
jgi:hypothetical protein